MFKKVIGQDLGPTGSPAPSHDLPSAAPSAPSAASSYSVPAPPSSSVPASQARPAAGATRNVLSSDVEIKGTVKFANDLVVDGKIEGEISSDGNLTVGENARIKAEIKTNTVVIYGKVHGNISVTDRVELKSSAEVVGDIKAKTLSIEAGAIFVGKSTVGTPAQGAPASKPAAEQKQGELAGTKA
ncbi:polymer-forming cytoskeletal protein [Luteolibacter sp. SL250]|uniref:bactofilin family protein n=1 Tax=Luteolibacter sp. SL250 TaxID=2995170 RepID=UPI002271CBDA|nr:polymer-forming cytoskeletal protein [Luteolibacter sp. SL250]WAC21626.1 polymer-forming cytoskeletal protein [Luteolibacter sp. SL250]